MKILVAGGAGYIGSALIPKLLDRGYKVDVIDLFWFGNHLPKEAGVVNKDLFRVDEQDLHGYEQVIFLAGLSNDPMAEFSPSKNFIYNAATPAYLAYMAKRAGIKRFIYAGSCSVYGYRGNELSTEEDPPVSNYPYGISKLQGERAVLQMVEKNFSTICLRQGTVCGYSPRMRLDLVVNAMFKSAMTDQIITVNNPSIWRPVLSMHDAADAYIRAIECHEDISGIFNIASGNYTVGEIADLVRNVMEQRLKMNIRLDIRQQQDFRNYKVSIEKARNILSFKPRHDIESIVNDLLDNKEQFKELNNPEYYNILVFKELEKKQK
ncbi:MAG: NAD(P)-dependent oxidoreductase [Candidatus Aureabacteria bacterium]|nr:NAD(P)-dependent oxidoreductase [Candidatus Auribacterota bacterium]